MFFNPLVDYLCLLTEEFNPFTFSVIIDRWGLTCSFPGGPVVKNLPADAGDAGDVSSIPGSRRSPGVGNGNPLQNSCLKIPWTEEPGGLESIGSQSWTLLSD